MKRIFSFSIMAAAAVMILTGTVAVSVAQSIQNPRRPYSRVQPPKDKFRPEMSQGVARTKIAALGLDSVRLEKADRLLKDFHKEELKIARMQLKAESDFDKKLRKLLSEEEYETFMSATLTGSAARSNKDGYEESDRPAPKHSYSGELRPKEFSGVCPENGISKQRLIKNAADMEVEYPGQRLLENSLNNGECCENDSCSRCVVAPKCEQSCPDSVHKTGLAPLKKGPRPTLMTN